MNQINITKHEDPGHGWYAVSKEDVLKTGLWREVSTYSYIQGSTVYLEEDCDAPLILSKLEALGYSLWLDDIHTDDDSFVRGLKRVRGEG